MSEQKCKVCGCTNNKACDGGCYWVAVDLCSKCADKLINQNKENTFIFNDKEYQGELGLFQLIYDLSQYGLFELDHDDFEEEGIKIIP